MSRAITFVALALAVAAAPVRAQVVDLDLFNRTDGPILPSDGWTQHTPPLLYFEVVDNQAMSPSGEDALMTYGGWDMPIQFDVHHSGDATSFESAAAILGFLDSDNYLEIKLVSNAGWNSFHSLLFRYVAGGVASNGWAGITPSSWFIYLDGLSFPDARITAGLTGDTVTVSIDPDFDALTAPLVYTRSGAPVGSLGTGVGLGVAGASAIDNFRGVPEPGTAALLLMFSVAALCTRRAR